MAEPVVTCVVKETHSSLTTSITGATVRSGSSADLQQALENRIVADQNNLKMTTLNKTPPGADPKHLERTATVREIGSQAVWSLSSCKPGFKVNQLRDDNLETYWQCDGSQLI